MTQAGEGPCTCSVLSVESSQKEAERSLRIMRWGIGSLTLRSLISTLGKINIHLILCGMDCSSNRVSSGSYNPLRRAGRHLHNPTYCSSFQTCQPFDSDDWQFVPHLSLLPPVDMRHCVLKAPLLHMRNPILWSLLSAFYWPSLYTWNFYSAGFAAASITKSPTRLDAGLHGLDVLWLWGIRVRVYVPYAQ